ncbi:type II toxin-antitoxin system RelE/ParE family toxin [Turicimonas muris]|uniref:type II toxin-antitoxin system RelE/ParE family toxin n=1 Tax=Turicimonas muris TaxID=1796652 RepID=UPI0024948A5F|nr:type II toxin-antitoxin system RelE/ParE family toxin [Turicimonas muris]
MIKSWSHKGLKKFFETGSKAGIQPKHADRLSELFLALDSAIEVQQLNLPGYRLHSLTGDREETWSLTVSGGWRITFEFRNGDAYITNYEDYH